MRIGYGKIGRALTLSPAKWGQVGGDNEPPILLNKLARAWPQHEFTIVTRASADDPRDLGMPDNVVNVWPELRKDYKLSLAKTDAEAAIAYQREMLRPLFADLDVCILWTGQHGTSNSPIPKVEDPSILTSPQMSMVSYTGGVLRALNDWRDGDPSGRQEIWLCPDPRNYLKARDLKWPPGPILAQYDWSRGEKHFRFGDEETDPTSWGATWIENGMWKAKHHYVYSELETCGIPSNIECSYDPQGRDAFGVVINEARAYVKLDRASIVRDWVLPLNPAWIHGKWLKPEEKLGLDVQPLDWRVMWDKLRTVRSTFTTPSSGSGWATTKPWEAFAVGTVCFFHPAYDTQDNILGRESFEHLKKMLRPKTPADLEKAVHAMTYDDDLWLWTVQEQRRLFDEARGEARLMHMIEERL